MFGVLRGIIIGLGLNFGLLASPVFAQDQSEGTTRSELTINDIAGQWRIEVIDGPRSAFKANADNSYMFVSPANYSYVLFLRIAPKNA